MNKFLFLFAFLFISSFAFSQGSVQVALKVKDKYGQLMTNTKVEFIEVLSGRKVEQKTSSDGIVDVLLEGGKEWRISILKIKDWGHWYVEVPKTGRSSGTMTVTYNYERYLRETQPLPDRSKITLSRVPQRFNSYTKADKENGVIKIKLKKPKTGYPVTGFEVRLTNFKQLKTYVATTNAQGTAYFKVPIDNQYEIDLEDVDSYGYVDLENKGFVTRNKTFTFEPTVINEKSIKDTVTQKLPTNVKPTSARKLVNLYLKGRGNTWVNEPVYLKEVHGTKVYKAYTDQNGLAQFLLPIKKRYVINCRYDKNIDVVDLVRSRGIGYMKKTARYYPNPKLQFPDQYIPSPEAIVIEGFEKFINKQLPEPSGDYNVGLNAEFIAPISSKNKFAYLQIGVNAASEIAGVKRKPVNISFVVDKSGSMYGEDRIDYVKQSLATAVDFLQADDFLSIITFNDAQFVEIPAQKAKTDPLYLKEFIERIYADGGTNIYKGLKAGYEEVLKNYKKNSVNRVILLTDGYGITPVDSLTEMSSSFNEQGIECSAVGVGEDYNHALLTQLASDGGGLFNMVKDASNLPNTFTEELNSLITPVAKNVSVEVTYHDKLIYKQVFGPTLEEKQGRKLKVKVKNLFSGLNQHFLIRFEAHKISKEIEKEPVIIKLKYYDLISESWVTRTETKYLEYKEQEGDIYSQIQDRNKKLFAVAIMNQTLKAMSEAFAKKDNALAISTIKSTLEGMKKLFPTALDENLEGLKNRLEEYLEILENLKSK